MLGFGKLGLQGREGKHKDRMLLLNDGVLTGEESVLFEREETAVASSDRLPVWQEDRKTMLKTQFMQLESAIFAFCLHLLQATLLEQHAKRVSTK